MDLRQLRYFIGLATQQNYRLAAEVLHIAQPALSRQIRLLEEELGVQLFLRHSRGATPTEEGLALLERASSLVSQADQLKQDMLDRRVEPTGTVSLGLSPGLATHLSAALFDAISKEQPGMRLRLVEGFSPSLQRLLAQGDVDLAVLNGPMRYAGLEVRPLITERMCLIGRSDHPALADREEIGIQELAGLPLVMTGLVKSGVRLELDAFAAQNKVVLNTVAEVETMQAAKPILLLGRVVTVHFSSGVQAECEEGSIRAVPIKGLSIKRVLACPSDRPVSRASERLSDIFRRVVARTVESGNWRGARLD